MALPVVAGNIYPGDMGIFVRSQQLKQHRKSDAFHPLLVPGSLKTQPGHGFKLPAAISRHGHADPHILKKAVLPGLVAHADIPEPEHLVIAQQAVACVLEQLRIHPQILPDNLFGFRGVLYAERQPVHQHLTFQLPAPFVMSTPVITPVITAGGPGGPRSSRFPFQAHSSRNVSRRACTRTTDRHPGRQIPPGIYRRRRAAPDPRDSGPATPPG